MPRPPAKRELLIRLLDAIQEGDWRYIVVEDHHPFLIRIFRNDDVSHNLRVFIWNCTHGGGTARPSREYRIQLTGAIPSMRSEETSLLLGWHEGYGVFVAFDIRRHVGQASASPSIQVGQDALLGAHTHRFASHKRHNNEIVIAFRPEYLVDYALNLSELHGAIGESEDSREILNRLDSVPESAIHTIPDARRREVVATIKRKYRQYDFRHRVLTAYNHHCAMCGVQLDLIEAAHILPVAHESSSDETSNGVALCALHHAAFDNNLVSFNEQYQIEVSDAVITILETKRRTSGLMEFRSNLKPALLLPADRRDYPKLEYVTQSRHIRRWE